MPVDYPEKITDPLNKLHGLRVSETAFPKYASFGTLFVKSSHRQRTEKVAWVQVPTHEEDAVFLMSIGVTYLRAHGGPFDEDDYFFADIMSIGVDPDTDKDIIPSLGWAFTRRLRDNGMPVSATDSGR